MAPRPFSQTFAKMTHTGSPKEPGGGEWPGEHKREDWGILDGRIVAVDYAAPAL